MSSHRAALPGEIIDTGSDLGPRPFACRKIAEPGSERKVVATTSAGAVDLYVAENFPDITPTAVVFVVVTVANGVFPAVHYWRVACKGIKPLLLVSERTNYAVAVREMRERNVKRLRT